MTEVKLTFAENSTRLIRCYGQVRHFGFGGTAILRIDIHNSVDLELLVDDSGGHEFVEGSFFRLGLFVATGPDNLEGSFLADGDVNGLDVEVESDFFLAFLIRYGSGAGGGLGFTINQKQKYT